MAKLEDVKDVPKCGDREEAEAVNGEDKLREPSEEENGELKLELPSNEWWPPYVGDNSDDDGKSEEANDG